MQGSANLSLVEAPKTTKLESAVRELLHLDGLLKAFSDSYSLPDHLDEAEARMYRHLLANPELTEELSFQGSLFDLLEDLHLCAQTSALLVEHFSTLVFDEIAQLRKVLDLARSLELGPVHFLFLEGRNPDFHSFRPPKKKPSTRTPFQSPLEWAPDIGSLDLLRRLKKLEMPLVSEDLLDNHEYGLVDPEGVYVQPNGIVVSPDHRPTSKKRAFLEAWKLIGDKHEQLTQKMELVTKLLLQGGPNALAAIDPNLADQYRRFMEDCDDHNQF